MKEDCNHINRKHLKGERYFILYKCLDCKSEFEEYYSGRSELIEKFSIPKGGGTNFSNLELTKKINEIIERINGKF